ncbi:FAD/NAD-P-binding domain-containing protein [Lentinula aciculospora]|uniref:FAD/NAD-P-binding domain-containing protein n=1 Tax=Lentinula aciculospora TaxID=153920 RepID=A0A9W9DVA6_9AGAR|nr:FAD/NAD-P-binding domain-containing protein [Lentinula aciculospora]
MTDLAATQWPSENDRGYRIPEQRFGTIHSIKIIAIGAGISGISLAHDVQEYGEQIELTIYEMGKDVGGTWYWNQDLSFFSSILQHLTRSPYRYPGCRCDIPSVNYQPDRTYQMSWCPNSNWSEYYSTAVEICRYYKDLVEKFGLRKYMRLSREVIRAEWIGNINRWKLTVKDPDGNHFEDECNIFINAGGVLNDWRWPDIEGIHDFEGTLCHTARWPVDFDYKDKRVAVIGSGSSGIQVLATIQRDVKQLYHWIRSPTWITPGFAQQFAGPGGKNFRYTEEQKKKYSEDPKYALKYRKMIESELNERFKFIVQGTPEQKAALEFARKDMCQRLNGNQRLIDAIVPTNFVVGCRRPTPGNGYLEALLEPNVHVFTEMFQRVTPKGFIDNEGNEYAVDAIVCATGFNTSFIPRFPVIGLGGINIQHRWKDYPIDSYLSLAVKDTPNYYMYYGPHGIPVLNTFMTVSNNPLFQRHLKGPTGHGSGAPMIEAMTRCFMQIIRKMQVENIVSMQVKHQAADDFNEHRELYLKRTAWAGRCSSWFKPGPDASPVMFPGNRVLFIELLTNPRWEDWDYEYGYAGNRFGYLGNGFTMREVDGRDTTFYYGLLNGTDEQPDYSDLRHTYAWM